MDTIFLQGFCRCLRRIIMSSDRSDNTRTAESIPPPVDSTNHTINTNTTPNTATTKSPLLLAGDEILMQGILPHVGVGQYAFIGPVNKKMNQLYKEYCKVELKKSPRRVHKDKPDNPLIDRRWRSAEITDTLDSETFCNLSRAEYWLKDDSYYSTHKAPDRDDVANAIAKFGNITLMQWARQQGFPWDEQTCFLAAYSGHLEMLQWLRKNGCPWNEWTCSSAAQNGQLEILSGLMKTVVHGMGGHVQELLKWIWKCSMVKSNWLSMA
ncbi:ankyrin repeat protein [Seminavis robusta]|uniref:Ankyrin repeat protein n=1 Tax=Seminavis robusta TaxID=568900 RepID=A0A9N8HIB7_9STRA|nr:ankyrin repeat protein [Seminavis robusta]|eukprot:Sro614_g175730.1 ankyrin repeat protein (267) ;mRNA; f:28951-29751